MQFFFIVIFICQKKSLLPYLSFSLGFVTKTEGHLLPQTEHFSLMSWKRAFLHVLTGFSCSVFSLAEPKPTRY